VTHDVVEKMIANGGEVESAHAVFLADAGLQTGDTEIMKRVGVQDRQSCLSGQARLPVLQPYRLARDCGAYLKSFAVAKRLGDARIVEAAKYNLDHAPSLEDFSFA
jgi:hypothetical protein